MSAAHKINYIRALELKIAFNKKNKGMRIYQSFYDWQHQFNEATRDNIACLLMAANQVGKSRTGCAIDAFHLTGDYPDNWKGHCFDDPPVCWLLGYSGEKTRDLLQEKLFGRYINKEFEGGYIRKELIIDHISMSGTPRAMREVRVQHVRGIAVCKFWSYSQGQHALMGDVVDWYHIDEEPEDHEIYPQVITRTINGDRGRGGRGILTFTPENGKTEIVKQFMDNDVEGQYLLTATWDQAPHISPEKKRAILSKYPEYQHDMRSRGVPLMGAGLIYPIDEGLVKVTPFEVPLHYRIINGMDFGWDHPWAMVQLALDEENSVFYVTRAFKRKKLQPFEAWEATKEWAQGVPVAWPQDGLQTRENGKEKRDMYIDAGFNLLDDFATWEGGGTSVQLGLIKLNKLFQTGQLRIFSNCHDLFEEIRQYHTKTMPDETQKIVKIQDDLLDALRYAFMMIRDSIHVVDLSDENDYYESYVDESDNAIGY